MQAGAGRSRKGCCRALGIGGLTCSLQRQRRALGQEMQDRCREDYAVWPYLHKLSAATVVGAAATATALLPHIVSVVASGSPVVVSLAVRQDGCRYDDPVSGNVRPTSWWTVNVAASWVRPQTRNALIFGCRHGGDSRISGHGGRGDARGPAAATTPCLCVVS